MILVIMLPFEYVRVLRAAFALIIVFRIEEVIDMRALRAVRFAYFPVLRIVIRPLRVLMYVSVVAVAGGKTAIANASIIAAATDPISLFFLISFSFLP